MVFEDKGCVLFERLRHKWHNTPEAPLFWAEFIKWMDLGVTTYTISESSNFVYYTIVDEKKWILTRLKYGV